MIAANNQILYTSLGGVIVSPKEDAFDQQIISNLYENGVGVITFDAPLTNIPRDAFFGQGELLSITLPDGIERICDAAFAGTSISEITIPQSVEVVDDLAFMSCHKLVKFVGKFASEDGRVLIVDGVLKFIATANMESYTIPEGVTTLDLELLCDDTTIEEIVLPSTVRKIEMSAFEGYDSLEQIVLNEGLEEIGSFAFNSPNIEELTIPSTVNYIGDMPFFQNIALERLILLPVTPPEMDDRYMLWEEDLDYRTIIVPQCSLELYRNADCWRKYKDIIVGNEDL
jgi:hypothetical protein